MTEHRFVLLMLLPAALFLGLLVAYPVALLVYNSFFDVKLIDPASRIWVGLANYADALTSRRLLESAVRTLNYSAFALLFELVFGFGAALLAAFVIGLLNTIVRPVLVVLTLPVTLVTLGLFLFVINALMFWAASEMLPGFQVSGFGAALLGSLIYSLLGIVIDSALQSLFAKS